MHPFLTTPSECTALLEFVLTIFIQADVLITASRIEHAFKVVYVQIATETTLRGRHVLNRQVKDGTTQTEATTFQLWQYIGIGACVQ